MIVKGHAPDAAEDFLLWIDVPDCSHIADPLGCCPDCFESTVAPIFEAYLDEHPECRPGSGLAR